MARRKSCCERQICGLTYERFYAMVRFTATIRTDSDGGFPYQGFTVVLAIALVRGDDSMPGSNSRAAVMMGQGDYSRNYSHITFHPQLTNRIFTWVLTDSSTVLYTG